jgi:transglutaminase-like putative cysteine protease
VPSKAVMKAETIDIEEYLRSTNVIDGDHPQVAKKSHELTGREEDDAQKARILFEWVRDAIPHSRDIGSTKVTCTASEVLREGTGICYAKSHLLAALCRSTGIPAGFCYQVFLRKPPHQGQGLHGLNAIYLNSPSKWIRLDARGNTGDIDAQFSLDEERLAFPVDPSAGELFIHDTIFCDPDPGVVAYLFDNEDLDAAWPDLPESLAGQGVE